MAYYDQEELFKFDFKFLGENVKVSQQAKIYDAEKINLGSNSRIDDFCIISGSVTVGRYCHITPMCLVAGGIPGVVMGDFVTLAYGTKVFAQSDDYSGRSMVNSLIPKKIQRRIFCESRTTETFNCRREFHYYARCHSCRRYRRGRNESGFIVYVVLGNIRRLSGREN
jgi:UDP-3-O-[3-hydroxymyristoyl] glucosamine N-acyltransferase